MIREGANELTAENVVRMGDDVISIMHKGMFTDSELINELKRVVMLGKE